MENIDPLSLYKSFPAVGYSLLYRYYGRPDFALSLTTRGPRFTCKATPGVSHAWDSAVTDEVVDRAADRVSGQ